jgi:hypothetical protein
MARATTRMTTRRLSVFTATILITPMLARLMATMGQTGSSTACLSVLGRGSTGFAADFSIGMISSEGGDSEAVSSTVIGDSEAVSAGVVVGTVAVLGADEADSMADEADSTAGAADSMEALAFMEAADSMEAVEADSMVVVATEAVDSTAVEVMAAAIDN